MQVIPMDTNGYTGANCSNGNNIYVAENAAVQESGVLIQEWTDGLATVVFGISLCTAVICVHIVWAVVIRAVGSTSTPDAAALHGRTYTCAGAPSIVKNN